MVPLSLTLTTNLSMISGNVMWLDDETSARALLKLTYDVEHVPEFSEPGQTSKSAVKAQEEGMDVDGSGGTGGLGSEQHASVHLPGSIDRCVR